ncbi:hypothetical protein NDU88_000825 [Pleurodeles waltl]|uniref:Uncharacterized protein n=1 Tax=Pleurodeles waltl TaxID=8319 RepID=A0AAV7NDX2_PLEWA|nr:hypothetical protein NDU88_000825 [Pleurodeles waltl]
MYPTLHTSCAFNWLSIARAKTVHVTEGRPRACVLCAMTVHVTEGHPRTSASPRAPYAMTVHVTEGPPHASASPRASCLARSVRYNLRTTTVVQTVSQAAG